MEVFKLVLLLGMSCLPGLEAEQCEMTDLCSCKFGNGTKIDITSLGNTDNTPRFKDVLSQAEGNFYSYNPCFGFIEDTCRDAAVCILNPDKSMSIKIGDSWKAGFKYDQYSGDTIVAYTSGSRSTLKLTEVSLVCDPNAFEPSIVANGQQKGDVFQMTLTTVCACADGCSSSGPNTSARESGAEN